MTMHPLFADILAAHTSAAPIVGTATDAREDGREPTSVPLSGVGSSVSRDLASIANHCQEIELILARMKKGMT